MLNENLNILLVEDNISVALDLEMNLSEMGHTILATVDRGDQALTYIKKEGLDMAIIDIGLKGSVDGVQVAKKFKEAFIPFIFSTVVKPIDKLTLQSCLDHAIRIKNSQNPSPLENLPEIEKFSHTYFFVKSSGSLYKVNFEDISYIQSDRNYCVLHAKGRKFAAKISLNNLIQKLPKNKFVRVHQSYIVCFDAIEKININEETISITETSLPLGKTYKSSIMKRINRI